MSILEFTNAGIYQLEALGMRVHPTLARLFGALRIVLSTSHDFPLDADEHPHPSSHELGDFHPENKEGTFSVCFRMQVAR